MKQVLIYFGLAVLLFVIGFTLSGYVIDFSIYLLDLKGLEIGVSSIQYQFKERFLFGTALGAIPLLLFLVRRIVGVTDVFQKFMAMAFGVMMFFGIISWLFRIWQVNNKLEKIAGLQLQSTLKNTIPFSSFNFGTYMLLGVVLGSIVSFLIVKRFMEGPQKY